MTCLKRLIALTALLTAAACGSSSTAPSTSVGVFTVTDLVVGTGTAAVAGNTLTVSYTGWLYDTSQTAGKGSSFDSNGSFGFVLGTGAVIKGWDQGLVGMKVGGQRRLIIPPELAYGSAGNGSSIPGNASLIFDIALLGVR